MNQTYRDLLYIKLKEILCWFLWTFQIFRNQLCVSEKIHVYWVHLLSIFHYTMINSKKWTYSSWIIFLNQSSYLKSVELSEILIKSPLIWYIAGQCRPSSGRIVRVWTNQSTFFSSPLIHSMRFIHSIFAKKHGFCNRRGIGAKERIFRWGNIDSICEATTRATFWCHTLVFLSIFFPVLINT